MPKTPGSDRLDRGRTGPVSRSDVTARRWQRGVAGPPVRPVAFLPARPVRSGPGPASGGVPPSDRLRARTVYAPAHLTTKAGEDSEEDDEEEPDDEDVEASLDTILKERLVVEEVEDDEDAAEPEERGGDGVERVLPKQPGEFVCRSCFLVKHPNQLADRKKMLCRDCV